MNILLYICVQLKYMSTANLNNISTKNRSFNLIECSNAIFILQNNNIKELTVEEKSKIIELFFLRMPIMKGFIALQDKDIPKKVIIQKADILNVFKSYLNNEFRLTKLKFLNHLNGLYFDNLELYLQRRIKEKEFELVVINSQTPQEIIDYFLNKI